MFSGAVSWKSEIYCYTYVLVARWSFLGGLFAGNDGASSH